MSNKKKVKPVKPPVKTDDGTPNPQPPPGGGNK